MSFRDQTVFPAAQTGLSKAETGARGEQAAAEWLLENGFEVVARNWRSGALEIDIVAVKEGAVHFVEVKTRAAGALTSPEYALDYRKTAALTRAARAWLRFSRFQGEVRFDLMAVDVGASLEVRYIPDAIEPHW